MKKNLLSFFALALIFAFSNINAQDLLFSQAMDEEAASGATSAFRGEVHYEIADNFTGVDGTVTQIVFYGLYAFNDGTDWSNADHGGATNINVRFYEASENQPDFDNPSVEHLNMPTTSIENSWTWPNGFEVWKYTVDIPATYVNDGWVSVQSVDGTGWLLWHKSVAGDMHAWQKNWNPAKNTEFASIGDDNAHKVGALEYDLAVEFYGTEGQIEEDEYMVTFRVNMVEAVVAHDFDPAVHNVFVTGNFLDPEWPEPGTEGSVELTLEAPTKAEVVVWEENFGAADASGALPEGWTQKKADNALGNNLQDLVDGDTRWWKYSELFDMGYTSGFQPDWIYTGEASMHINWNVEDEQNVYAITPLMELPEADEMFFEFWMYFSSAYHTEMNVLMSVDGGAWTVLQELNSTDNENLYSEAVVIDITGQEGTAQFAFVYKWTDGIQMNVDAIKVYGTTEDQPNDDIFYTATVEIPAGDIEYKYFSDAVGEGWAGGEWEAGDNRTATIAADVTLDDVFGLGTSVQNILAEAGLNLFPNPVRNTLYVENTAQINEVRIYDLTGRLIMSQVVNNNTASVNVSEFNRGVYIMQVISENGVASQKFNVIK